MSFHFTVLFVIFSLIPMIFMQILPAPIPLTGNLKPNNLLSKTQYFAQKKIAGPESIVFDNNGLIYTGLANGQIVQIDKNGNTKKIVQTGEETNETICNAPNGNPKCGRPFGLRIIASTSTLYACDGYFGLLKINLINGSKTLILSANDKRFGAFPLKFVNDLDLDSNGNIYFVDTSYVRGENEALIEFFDVESRGRLYRYNELTDELELLLEKLYFPNGVQLTPNKDAVLVTESSMARIIKYNLVGAKKGTKELFANLPGNSDNIRLTDRNTLLVPFNVLRSTFTDLIARNSFVRTTIKNTIGYLTLFGLLPKYGLVVEYDLNGNPLKSWHDPTGKTIIGTSQATLYQNKLYLGSFLGFIDYIGVVDY